MKKALALLLCAALTLTLFAGCGEKPPAVPVTTGEIGVLRDEEFGNIYLDLTIDAFNDLGFAFGDSVDVALPGGAALEDIPYYSGYYVPVGSPLLCGYPGYPHPVIAFNYGDPTWETYGMTDDAVVTVTLREKGKYAATQDLFSLQYSDERADFDSDQIFANFREVTGGSLKPKTLYRSASPCDNQHGRAAYANRFAEAAGVRFVLNLSDSEGKYVGYTAEAGFDSAYYDSLYRAGNVLLLAMNANYRADAFAATLSEALYAMAVHEGPCLVHCVEGKDRTGFVCALLLALSYATADEITADYMITYANYYGVTKETRPDTYEAIRANVDDFLRCICEAGPDAPVASLNLHDGAVRYLRRGGLSDTQIAAVETFLTK